MNTSIIETNAGFKSQRESLGLTVQWIADAVGVTLRTAQYWEAGRMSIPDNVFEKLREIDNLLLKLKETLNKYAEEFKQKFGAHTAVPLIRYRTEDELWRFQPETKGLPLTAYTVCLAQIQENLKSTGKFCWIGFFDEKKYTEWLIKYEEIDTELARAEWISSYYRGISAEMLKNSAVFTKFIELSNNGETLLCESLDAEGCSKAIDEIASYEIVEEPRLRLLAFYLRCAKYYSFKDEQDRTCALELSRSLWSLGENVEEQLYFSDFLIGILKLCHLSSTRYEEGDFSKYFLSPLNGYFSDNTRMISKNLLKIFKIAVLLICVEEYPQRLGLKSETYDLNRIRKAIRRQINSVYTDSGSATTIWLNFLKKHGLCDERIEQTIYDLNPQFLAERSAKQMTWHHVRYQFDNIPRLNKDSLIGYLGSSKEFILNFTTGEQDNTAFIGSVLKMYMREGQTFTLGKNTDNFYLFLGGQLLSKVFEHIDFSLDIEQQRLFEEEINHMINDQDFLVTEQSLLLKRGLIQGLRGNYMEAAFLLMPYIENLIRIRATEEGWHDIDRNGGKKTPDKVALEYFLKKISSQEKRWLLQFMYTIISDVPNQDIEQTANQRIGDNLRNLSFHGLMEDAEVFSQVIQAKYIMIWLIMAILVLDIGVENG